MRLNAQDWRDSNVPSDTLMHLGVSKCSTLSCQGPTSTWRPSISKDTPSLRDKESATIVTSVDEVEVLDIICMRHRMLSLRCMKLISYATARTIPNTGRTRSSLTS